MGYNVWDELDIFTNTATGDIYTYEYDAEGLRIKKTGPGSTTKYHYDLGGRVIAESDGSGTVAAQNIWGHRMLARKIGANYYYYLYNGHGNVVQILNESGSIVNRYSYDEWGNIRSKTEGISNPIRYAGEYYDDESGLYYLRARYYDPVIARFITRDTYEGDISSPLSINQYTYCWNNPIIYIDPTGHYTQLDFSNWTGTAEQAAQLQSLYTNYEAYNTGAIDADTASSNYNNIMYHPSSGSSNGGSDHPNGVSPNPIKPEKEIKITTFITQAPSNPTPTVSQAEQKKVFDFYYKLGTGIQVKVKVMGIGFELGFERYYEKIETDNPYDTMGASFNIQITNKLFIGAQGSKSKSAITGQEIKGSGTGFIGIKVGDHALGFGDLPNSGDVTAETEVGALTPLGGFVAGIKTNLSELWRRLFH